MFSVGFPGHGLPDSGAMRIGFAGAIGCVRILLDECVPWPMHRLLTGHERSTSQQTGWGGIENGQLLKLAESRYDLFIPSDQNIRYQQNLSGRQIAILELSTNNLRRIEAAQKELQIALANIKSGDFRQFIIP